MTKIESFWHFINEKRDEAGYSWLSLEHAAGLSNGGLTKRRDALGQPSVRVCIGLSKALNIPLEDIMRRAGILSKDILGTVVNNPSLREVLAVMRQLNEQQQRDLLDYAKWKLDQTKRDA